MYCSWCTEFKAEITDPKLAKVKSYSFIEGSNNFRKSTIHDHENGASHTKARSLKLAQQTGVAQSEAGKALISIKEKERKRLQLLFRNAHATIKHNKSMRDYVWMVKLDKIKGLDVGETYANQKACGLFVDAIANVTRQKVMDEIAQCSYFAITMDGTTDASCKEQENLFVRIAGKGKQSVKFLKLASPKSTTGEDLAAVVKATLQEIAGVTSLGKFSGFTCDGASNMIGKNKGM